jgi:glycosyltransferase involved in cell wall biosynthesis
MNAARTKLPEPKKKLVIVANTSWYLHNFRLPFIQELQTRSVEVVALAPRDAWSDQLTVLGVRYIEVPMSRRGLNPLVDFSLLVRFLKIFRDERPDFVFHNTIKPVIYGSIAARWAGVRCVVNMIPGLGYVFIGKGARHRLLRPLVKMMYKFALSDSHKVFFQNQDDLDYFVDAGIVERSRAILTLGSGVDLDRFYFVESARGQAGCVCLFVGRLLWDKGVGEFVEAAKALKKRHGDLRFVLLGRLDPGNPAAVTAEVVKGWEHTGDVEYLGERPDVRPVIAQADVVVLPSYREGVPKALLEAMAMGKPIITTDAPGCKETVVDGRNGLLVPPRDASGLTVAMEKMLNDPELRNRMGKEGRTVASERFDVRAVNAILLESLQPYI